MEWMAAVTFVLTLIGLIARAFEIRNMKNGKYPKRWWLSVVTVFVALSASWALAVLAANIL